MSGPAAKTFYEFFAGGGMARTGLGDSWNCLFANEFCEKKAAAYRLNFPPAKELKVADVAKLSPEDLPGQATLAWASFPCQDLSLAGNGRGLDGARSGTFHAFWNLMTLVGVAGRAVPVVVLENVAGAITSNNGRDFQAILKALTDQDYRVGAVNIDASRFLPQSRPRVFFIAVKRSVAVPQALVQKEPGCSWHSKALVAAYEDLPEALKSAWIWWRLPEPPRMTATLTELIESEPRGVTWHAPEETARLVSMMSPANLEKLRKAQNYGKTIAGTIYKRMRLDESGIKAQRAEVRFDQISGCLRTPTGGSSRQLVLVVEGDSVRSRLLSPREAARLMGVPESYILPEKYNDAYHLMGDGLAVPVVAWLEQHLLAPIAQVIRLHSRRVA